MRYYVNHVDGFPIKMIENLEKKGLLLDTKNYVKDSDFDEEGKRKVDMITLYTTPEFDQKLEEQGVNVDFADAYEELLDSYPYEIHTATGTFPARTGTSEKNAANYLKYLLKHPNEHEKIVKATAYGRDNKLIKWGIEKYIENKYWGLMIEQMEGENRREESGEQSYGNNEF